MSLPANAIAKKPDPFRISSVERTSSDGLRPLFPTTYLLSKGIKRVGTVWFTLVNNVFLYRLDVWFKILPLQIQILNSSVSLLIREKN